MPINTIYRARSALTFLAVVGFMAPAPLLVGCGGSGSGGPPIAPPTVTLSSPTAGASVSGPVTLQVATTSSAGIQSVQFTIDGVALGNLVTQSPYTETWDPASVPAGAHELAAVARDVAGNTVTSAPVSVIVSHPSVQSTHFSTLTPSTELPDEATCAAQIRPSAWEPRTDNTTANHTNVYASGARLTGSYLAQYGYEARVTGNFTGTTDEIIQWVACKWGIDEDIVRAQAVQESYWHQSTLGDCRGGTVPETSGCQSVGLLQVKGADLPPTHPGTWPYAYESTAFNVDYAYGVWRACYEGKETWLGNGYAAGDAWGCAGRWFSGDWYLNSQAYIASVKHALAARTWTTAGF